MLISQKKARMLALSHKMSIQLRHNKIMKKEYRLKRQLQKNNSFGYGVKIA